MRIIILNQFFYPDHSATSQLMTDLAEDLVARGIEVTALAGRGRYNGGDRLPAREKHKGVRVERAWATSFGKRSVAGRLCDYLSFYVGAAIKLMTLPRHDIIMALTTPPLIALVALAVARLRGMRVVLLMQDLYPDVAVALGAIGEESFTTRVLDWLSRASLRAADRIIVLGDCMRERVLRKMGEGATTPIDVIHNWADGAKVAPLQECENPFRAAHGLEDSFVILFSGNFGLVNEFSTVLDAARRLSGRAGIVFLFIGDGAKADEINSFAEQHKLSNVRMLPYQPREMLRFSLAAGDVALVTLAEGLAGLSVPSKTYAVMASGKPVLFVGDPQSDIARIVGRAGCGAVVAPGDGESLARIIEGWAAGGSQIAAMGAKARAAFEESFDRPLAVSAYMESFAACMNDAPAAATEQTYKATGAEV